MYTDDYYLHKLKAGQLSALDIFFKRYREDLLRYAFHLVGEPSIAEDIVQDVFVSLWENREKVMISENLKPYLVKVVFNDVMDLRRHEKVKEKYRKHSLHVYDEKACDRAESQAEYNELNERLTVVLDSLPAQQKSVYTKIRLEGKKYKDVAEEMGISIKTVEGHFTKAQKKVRTELQDFILILCFALWF
ncbi:DNA-directed RNA polymerase sigma-70 factor [Fulvitalea axinellae]|uniref:DNA-directed RNA polymerase sigma-70 factor n=1 Tax=Fulvitalea axinellae TaxID=1182444 RepID=A0AAU9CNC5_9BACT|nr:DNA-directed RNA polymerase sigma-70 factor [Fulvitalea axinellae]